MARSAKRLLWTVLGALLLACSALLVACGQKGEKATLTLLAEGGTPDESTYEVRVGDNLHDFLEGVTLRAEDGLEFAGWFENGTSLAADRTMPADGLTLQAKFYAGYTVDVYRQDTEGNYPAAAERAAGKAIYGEAFAYAAEPHFSVDETKQNNASSASLGKGETFTVYLKRDMYNVVYYANEPTGALSDVRLPRQEAYYGTQTTLADGAQYALPANYRFAGWSKRADGGVDYLAGDLYTDMEDVALFAVWETAYNDMMGGSDRIFLSLTEENTVYLRRQDDPAEKAGKYDPATGAFTFTAGEGDLLEGRLQSRVVNGAVSRVFFYYRDTLARQYPDMDGTSAKLTVDERGGVTYVDGEGNEKKGTYSIDAATHYFVFEPEDGSAGWLFSLYEPTDGSSNVVFRRQDTEEAGYYYAEEEDIILYLDGLGGLEYHYNTSNYPYVVGNTPVLVAYGYYEWSDTARYGENSHGMYIAYTRDATQILFNLAFRIDRTATPTVDLIPFDLAGMTIAGAAVRDDGFRAIYTDKWGSTDGSLYLDGFGYGEFGEGAGETDGAEKGSYTVLNWLYSYEDEDGEDVYDDYYLIRFESESGIRYFRLDTEYGEFEVDRFIDKATVLSLTQQGYSFGQFFIDRLYVMGVNQTDSFIYIFENGDAEVWSSYADMSNGDVCYVLYYELISSVVKEGDVYHFQATFNESTGEMYGTAFDFTIAGNKATMVTEGTSEILRVSDRITLDLTAGQATYDGVAIPYGFTLGQPDMYIFKTPVGTQYYLRNGNAFEPMDTGKAFTATFPRDREAFDRVGMLYLDRDGHARFALMLDNGLYRFVGEGTVQTSGGESIFTLDLATLLSSLGPDDYDGYTEFTFKTYPAAAGEPFGTFIQKYDGFPVYDNLTTDGYGKATYTDKDGKQIEGEFALVIETIYFFSPKSGTAFVVAAREGEHSVTLVEDAGVGIWGLMNDNGLLSQTDYALIDGLGTITYYTYNTQILDFEREKATYVKSKNYTPQNLEYVVTKQDGSKVTVLVGVRILQNGLQILEAPIYQEQMPWRVGDFETADGGSIVSSGYPADLATYETADGTVYEGNMYIVDVTVPNDAAGEVTYTHTEDGDKVQFVVYENGVRTNTQFVFERGEKLTPIDNVFRVYARENHGILDETVTMQLDGKGGAVLRSGSTQTGQGSYRYLDALQAYQFDGRNNNSPLTFAFRLSSRTEGDSTVHFYSVFNAEENGVFSGAGWSLVTSNGYGGAVFVDRYGVRYSGDCVFITDTLACFTSAQREILFRYDVQKSTFTLVDNSDFVRSYYAPDFSSAIFTETRFITNDEEAFYVAEGGKATVYRAEGGTYVSEELTLPSGTEFEYGGETYRLWDGNAITFTDDEFSPQNGGAVERLTLSFLPQGAHFTVDATLQGDDVSYQFTLGFENGAPAARLIRRSSLLLSVETYPVTLRFTGETNTFTIVPLGKDTTYQNYATGNAQTGEWQDENGGVFTVDNRRVGGLYVGDGFSFTLAAGATDSAGAPIRLEGGKYTDCAIGADEDFFNYNGGAQLSGTEYVYTGTDNVKYTLHFMLYEARANASDPRLTHDCFELFAITVDSTFEVAGAGKTEFSQFWYSATGKYGDGASYRAHYEKYDLIQASVSGNDVETVVHKSVADNSKAFLVRQTMNTTTGDYRYEGFVFDVTYGADGFISGVELEANYRYGELETPQHKQLVRFLYEYDGSAFTVKYLLTFSESDRLVEAAFTETATNVWTIAVAGGNTYTATFRKGNGAMFAWTLTQNV